MRFMGRLPRNGGQEDRQRNRFIGAMLLADDFINRKINNTAETVCGNTGAGKKTAGICALAIGATLNAASQGWKGYILSGMLVTDLISISYMAARLKAEWFESKPNADGTASQVDLVGRIGRRVLMTLSAAMLAYGAISSEARFIGEGLFSASMAALFHLMSTGNGTLDRAKKAVQVFFGKVAAFFGKPAMESG